MKKSNILYLYAFGVILLFITFVICITFGAFDLNFDIAIRSLISGNITNSDLRILLYVRIPRCLGAVLAGLSLAVSGVLIQAVLNNPMAAPNIIGVNSGAGLAVIVTVSVFPNMLSFVPLAAFCGALLSCILIFLIAQRTCADRITITLVGIAVTSILNAAINAVKTVFPNSVYNLSSFSVGGLGGVNTKILACVFPIIIVCLILSVMLSRNIDLLCLGEGTASNLGMNVPLQRMLLLILASALAGCAVSFAGLIGFVGLVVPHIIRSFVGNKHCVLIPLSAIFGAEFVLLSDLFCRTAFRPYEIPVGIVLSFIGGIFFICLILIRRKGRMYD